MGKKQVIPVGRSPERLLSVVDSDTVQKIKKKKELSYHAELMLYYRKLFQLYFEKFARWQAIAEAEGIITGVEEQKIEVFTAPSGLHIAKLGEIHPQENKVLELRIVRQENSNHQISTLNLTVTPGDAGAQLFVDVDSNPIKKANIHLLNGRWQQAVEIYATIPPYKSATTYPYTSSQEIVRKAHFDILMGDFTHYVGEKGFDTMLPDYATYMFNTIDALIPGSTIPKQQPKRRARQKLHSP